MNIFKELALNDDNNVIISPLSIYQALSLTSNGARSSTLQGMLNTLDSSSIESLNRRNIEIIKAISAQKDLFIANAVFAAQSPIETFIQIAKMYKAEVSRLKSASQVNGWCAKNTNNKIPKIIDTIAPNTKMILLNAVYFKSKWLYQFDPRRTTVKPFYLNANEKKNMKMMYMEKKFNYYEDYEMQAIELPYEDKELSARSNMKMTEVHLTLPKFEMRFEKTMKAVLSKMGMSEAFNPGKADLSGLFGSKGVWVDDVIHKTYLKVEEVGTEAAAVTAVVIRTRSIRPHRKKQSFAVMNVNRPFLFMIQNKQNDLIFMSKISKL